MCPIHTPNTVFLVWVNIYKLWVLSVRVSELQLRNQGDSRDPPTCVWEDKLIVICSCIGLYLSRSQLYCSERSRSAGRAVITNVLKRNYMSPPSVLRAQSPIPRQRPGFTEETLRIIFTVKTESGLGVQYVHSALVVRPRAASVACCTSTQAGGISMDWNLLHAKSYWEIDTVWRFFNISDCFGPFQWSKTYSSQQH